MDWDLEKDDGQKKAKREEKALTAVVAVLITILCGRCHRRWHWRYDLVFK
ncbi:MAG: hypothetical protein ACLR23_25755 [Clostridia bacterium]